MVYIADNQTLYTWDGEPVAYLAPGGSVYGFNGQHLGWLPHGLVVDHDGNTPCAVREALNPPPGLEPLKALKALQPLKALQELAPLTPLPKKQWSRTGCKAFMEAGR